MVGGPDEAVRALRADLQDARAAEDGYAHVGPPGAGHYVKMIHNGIEYGMLQAYAEGYEILHASKDFEARPRTRSPRLWNHGSVVRSWLNELAESAFAKDAEARRDSRDTSTIRAKGDGRCRRRSTSTCRRRSSRCRCSCGSGRGRTDSFGARSSPRCGTNSAATR